MAAIPPIEPYALPSAAELPANVARWTVDPSRAVLLVHDMQRYFLRPLPATLQADLVRNAALILEQGRAHGVGVAYTAQPGAMMDEQRGLLKDFWGQGMTATAADREVIEQLAPGPGDWVFTKWRYSAFFGSRLLDQMREQGRDQLVICGVYAHVGVLATAVQAFSHDIETFIVADAVADFSQRHHQMALEYASQCCAVITTAKEVFA